MDFGPGLSGSARLSRTHWPPFCLTASPTGLPSTCPRLPEWQRLFWTEIQLFGVTVGELTRERRVELLKLAADDSVVGVTALLQLYLGVFRFDSPQRRQGRLTMNLIGFSLRLVESL